MGQRCLEGVGIVSSWVVLVVATGCGGPSSSYAARTDTEAVRASDAGSAPTRAGSDSGVVPTHAKFVGNITQRYTVPPDFGVYWNQITPENEGKWASVEGERNQMRWQGLDRVYQFAEQQAIPVKGHTLVWGQQAPEWLTELSADEQAREVEEWIRLFCERYPNTEMIDVVNEPEHSKPSFADALGGAGETGYDWVIWSFEKAREYCPNSVLILNDYNVLRHDTRAFLNVAYQVQAKGLLDAIGCQAHSLESQSLGELRENLQLVGSLGVPIYISEYDVDIEDDELQLDVMRQQFSLFYESDTVVGITLWGYISGQTWRENTGLLRDGQPRPALDWLNDYLQR